MARERFREWQRRAGQAGRAVDPAMLHLTLCVVDERRESDADLPRRIAAVLSAGLPRTASIRFGRVRAHARGAELITRGAKGEIEAFFQQIAARFRTAGIAPLHRAAGLRPHVTLGYDCCSCDAFEAIWHWLPDRLALIESRPRADRRGRKHIVLRDWPLCPPGQSSFAFMIET